jgi:amino acid adenylation domain-containing protein
MELMTETGLPLSFAQEQLWFIDEFHNGLPAHNLANLVRLRGPLDVAALRRALDGLVARHETLRTRLLTGADGHPVQVIDPPAVLARGDTAPPGDTPDPDGPEPPAAVREELIDYSAAGPEIASERLREFAAHQALRPFHLATDAPLRWSLVRLAPDEHALVIVAHQTAVDEWSVGVLLSELAALYRAQASGGEPDLNEVRFQFASHAQRERHQLHDDVLASLEDYWRGSLAGLQTTQFPTDRPRPVLASHDGAVEVSNLGPELLDGLRGLASSAGAGLSETLLAALLVLLCRYTGQTDLVVGTVSEERTAELAPLVGFLAAALPIRADLSGDPAFGDVLARVLAAAEGARAHRELPFARIVEAVHVDRDPGRFPVFQVELSCAEPVSDIESAGVTFHRQRIDLRASRYDLSLLAEPGEEGLLIRATYTPALFDAVTVRRLLGHLEVLLRGAVADPQARLSQLPVLTASELRAELHDWNDTTASLPVTCIHLGFEAQVTRDPDAVAAQFESEQWTYAELNTRANKIARRLRGLGVGPEALVGVCMATGLPRIAALLGIWKAGGGYVPMDPALPPDRLSFIAADTAMAVLLADDSTMPSLLRAALPTTGVPVISLDADDAHLHALDSTNLDSTGPDGTEVTPSNVAYVIYTSGSTGQPKGVVVEHHQAINFLHGMIGAWHITPSSAVLQFAAVTFDVSVMDMFMPLLAGARVVLAPPDTLHSPPRLAALMRDSRVTFACLPPAVLNLLIGEDFPELATLLSAGEELSSELLRHWLRDGLDIYNGYGPTECSIGSTFMKLEPSTPLPPPIGRPKPNYRAYVLDGDLNPVPVGVTGELHIGGAGVARGYLNRPELTTEKFITDPFIPGGRLYKTGDLVRRRPDGTIVFAGRIDNQVKIRGLRVELGEIETALTTHPAIAQAVATVITDQAGHQQLAAYLRPANGTTPAPADIRQYLAARLPGYMIPGYLITVDHIPLTPNGKIDKSALPAPATSHDHQQAEPPATLIETVLVDIYATILGHEHAGATDSFFDAGGNSLQAMQLIAKLRAAIAVDLDVSSVFLAPTPRQLAALLRDEHGYDDVELGEDGIEGLTPAQETPAC